MAVAEVSIRTSGVAIDVVIEKVKAIDGMLEVQPTTGEYNLVSRIVVIDLPKVARIVAAIRGVDGVIETKMVLPKEFAFISSPVVAFVSYIVYPLLCILPTISTVLGWESLRLFAQVPNFELPTTVILSAAFLIAILYLIAMHANYCRVRKGGCFSSEDTITLLKDGPYAIIRHPSTLGGLAFILLLPIVVSGFVVYTLLTVLGQVLVFCLVTLVQVPREEEFGVKKWGQEYAGYMQLVPRFNFFLGILRWSRRRKAKPP